MARKLTRTPSSQLDLYGEDWQSLPLDAQQKMATTPNFVDLPLRRPDLSGGGGGGSTGGYGTGVEYAFSPDATGGGAAPKAGPKVYRAPPQREMGPPIRPKAAPDPQNSADTRKAVNRLSRGRVGAATARGLQRVTGDRNFEDLMVDAMVAGSKAAPYVAPTTALPFVAAAEAGNAPEKAPQSKPAPPVAPDPMDEVAYNASRYMEQRKPLPAGVRRWDAGLDTPGRVYATVDKNGNRVYTDDAAYAGRVSNGRGLTRDTMPRNDQMELRAAALEADPNAGYTYTDPMAISPQEIAALRDGLGAMDPNQRVQIEPALAEIERANEIEAARLGVRPIDQRRARDAEVIRSGRNLYRPPGEAAGGDISPLEAFRLQMQLDDRAYNRARDARGDQAAAAAAEAQAAKDAAAGRERQYARVIELEKMMNEVDEDGRPMFNPTDVLPEIASMFPEGMTDEDLRSPMGQRMMKIVDQAISRSGANQGGPLSRLDSDARFSLDDLRLTDPNDPMSSLYAMERPETLGLQGRAEFGNIAQLARQLGMPPEQLAAMLQYRMNAYNQGRTE